MELKTFSDKRCLGHIVPPGYPERPERVDLILKHLRSKGLEIDMAEGHHGARDAVAKIHDLEYLERFETAIGDGLAILDTTDTPLSYGTWEASWAAVETCLRAADWVGENPDRIAFAAVRPPGHHAERDMAMGFCYFNNVAVAAQYLLDVTEAERVAIVDFDVHHGNGTQHTFYTQPDVLYVSSHQYPFYPGTGASSERGEQDGLGSTLNMPLPAGAGDERFRQVFHNEILPAVRSFKPDILLLSAGFDAWQQDPVGGLGVSVEAFRNWGEWLGQVARETCQGRILLTLEGGYDLPALGALVLAHLQGLVESFES